MTVKKLNSTDLFDIINTAFLIIVSLLCLLPIIHIAAVSLSSSSSASAGLVRLLPKDFTLSSYQFVLKRVEFWRAMFISFRRIILGGLINLLLSILIAYPLSKETHSFRWRTIYAWVFFITILFNGGLIPWYMVIKSLGLIDTIWALVLPGAVPVTSIVLLLNFFRQLPKEFEEAGFIDGASHWTLLWKIYVPTSAPALATITLFSLVYHWNSWFDGIILMNRPEHYPMQSYLQTVVIRRDISLLGAPDRAELEQISERTIKAAQIFLGSLPILTVYPFLQRYFVKGIVIGSVKG